MKATLPGTRLQFIQSNFSKAVMSTNSTPLWKTCDEQQPDLKQHLNNGLLLFTLHTEPKSDIWAPCKAQRNFGKHSTTVYWDSWPSTDCQNHLHHLHIYSTWLHWQNPEILQYPSNTPPLFQTRLTNGVKRVKYEHCSILLYLNILQ